MKHKPRIKSAFIFLLLLGVLFGALALIPVLAQSPRHGRAAPDEPLVQAMVFFAFLLVRGLTLPRVLCQIIESIFAVLPVVNDQPVD